MKKRAKIHLLPTEPSSAETCIGVRGNIMAYHLAIHHLALSKFYHIYITTDDEIKEGDWYYVSGGIGASIGIYKAEKSPVNNDWRHKIIATTDPKLYNKVWRGMIEGEDWYEEEHLPQPSKEFIKEYCRAGGIDEVDVEYLRCWDDQGVLKPEEAILSLTSNNEIIIHPIKDSWTLDELPDLLNRFCNDHPLHRGLQITDGMIREWLKKQ